MFETNEKTILRLLFFWVINDFVHNFQEFLADPKKNLGISQDVRFLVFKIWSILYSTVVISELGTCKKSGRDFCKICRWCYPVKPKACEVQGRSPGGGQSPHQYFFQFLLTPECITRVKYKIDHILKAKNLETLRIFWDARKNIFLVG